MMSTFFVPLSLWLHTLATIVMVGHYVFTGLIYLPVFEHRMKPSNLCELLEQVSTRLRPYFGGSLLIFMVTGTYLMLINQDYRGLGHFFDNPWSVLIVIKHVFVLAFLILAIYSERAYMRQISDENLKALKNFHLSVNINMILGIAIILMTTIAQTG